MTTSMSATIYSGGSLSAVLPNTTTAMTGTVGNTGGIAANLPKYSGSLSGGTYRMGATLPRLAGMFTAVGATQGGISANLPRYTAALSGQTGSSGAMGLTLTRPAIAAAGYVGILATLAPQLQPLQIAVSGVAATLGALSVKTRALTSAFVAGQGITATMSLRMQPLSLASVGYYQLTQLPTQVMNTLTNSVTHYVAYPYNSFAEFGGRYLAAGPGGLYQVEVGGTDTGASINASLSFGQTDFDNEYQKRVSDYYIGMRSGDDINLTVTVDEKYSASYLISPFTESELKQRRSGLGKGLKGKYWQFGLTNTNGADFDFDTMNVAAVPLSRRV